MQNGNILLNNEAEIKHYDVETHVIHGTTLRIRLVVLIGAFCFVCGFFIGGLILPYLQFKPNIEEVSNDPIDAKRDALMVSIGAQTVWLNPMEGAEAISTNFSVEQLISEYEVMASQAGYQHNIEFARKDNSIEARFTFKEPDKKQRENNFIAAPQKDFPKTIVLNFIAGQTPGTIILDTIRKNGEILSKGEAFVSLVEFGMNAPELAEGQHLTKKGIFEIKTNEFGAIATLDNKQIFPILEQAQAKLPFNNDTKKIDEPKEGSPMLLKIFGFEPNNSLFRERFILVAYDTKGAACTSQAIIIDITRSKTNIIPHLLLSPNVVIGAGKKTINLSGFCENGKKPLGDAKTKLEISYNLMTGIINENRIINTMPIENNIETANQGNWRQTSPTRIASPYGAGGALISLSCRPGGGVSIGVSGLPSPIDGKSSKIIFDSNMGSATAAMAYLPNGSTYEINDILRPLETKQIIKVLKAQGQIKVTGAGGVKNISAPNSTQIENLVNSCGQAIITQPKISDLKHEKETNPVKKAAIPTKE